MNTQLKFNFSDGYSLGIGLADTEHSWGTKEGSKGGERRRSWNDISHIRSVWRETDKPDQNRLGIDFLASDAFRMFATLS